jgi:hypothetical protein
MSFSTAIPEKPNVMYIWSVMDELIKEFSEKISKMQPDSEKDAKAFDAIILAMNKLQDYSVKMQSLLWWWLPDMLEKARLGKEAGLVFKNHFGDDRLPPLEGVKSMTYIRDIILPFMKYIADIDSEGWLVLLCKKVGVDFDNQIELARSVVAGIKNRIEDYDRSHTSSADQKTTDVASRQQEISASTKHIKGVSVTISGYFAAEIVDEDNLGLEDTRTLGDASPQPTSFLQN